MPIDKKTHILLSRSEVLDRYGIGNTTLYRWLSDGRFVEPIRFGPRCIRWKLQDLEAWEQQRQDAAE
ncbi:helix-turn-helix transcriptional regulator [Endozoicomonas sp.]|uniref:helix-turn-helix transcriptional regulator n=1 Tax=Endozoicomonas sp. TaxID=1892382 RepID=UPI00383A2D9F